METTPRHPPLPEVLTGRRLAILGAGTVGQALGSLLRAAGLPPVAVTSRDPEHAAAAALVTGGEPMVDNAAAAAMADTVLITASDSSVAEVARQVATSVASGTVVAHVCGALGLDPLYPVRDAGASVGSMHPLQSFASVQHAIRELPGSVFGVTADPSASPVLEALVATVGGIPVPVAEDARPLYHAAAVLASNYLVVLEDIARDVLVRAGFEEALAAKALEPLVRGTTGNIRRCGTLQALTGPVMRGDVETVRAHLEALESESPEALRVYRVLGAHAVQMAWERGTLSEERREELRRLFGDGAGPES